MTWLGTSSGAPTLVRNVSCTLVRMPQRVFLVDCGEGTHRQLLQTGIDLNQVGVRGQGIWGPSGRMPSGPAPAPATLGQLAMLGLLLLTTHPIEAQPPTCTQPTTCELCQSALLPRLATSMATSLTTHPPSQPAKSRATHTTSTTDTGHRHRPLARWPPRWPHPPTCPLLLPFPQQVEAIFVTHLHGDHCFGLASMLASLCAARAAASAAAAANAANTANGTSSSASSSIVSEASSFSGGELRVYGPPGLGELLRALLSVAGGERALNLPLTITEFVMAERWALLGHPIPPKQGGGGGSQNLCWFLPPSALAT